MRRESVIYFTVVIIPGNLNSSGHCICVHEGKISVAIGLELGTPEHLINYAIPLSYPDR